MSSREGTTSFLFPGSASQALLLPEERTHLDHAAVRYRRNALRDRHRLGGVLAFDQVISPELLLGLGERAVGDCGLAASGSHGGSGRNRLQSRAGDVLTGSIEALQQRAIVLHYGVALCSRNRFPPLLLEAAQKQVLHRRLLSVFSRPGQPPLSAWTMMTSSVAPSSRDRSRACSPL